MDVWTFQESGWGGASLYSSLSKDATGEALSNFQNTDKGMRSSNETKSLQSSKIVRRSSDRVLPRML